jgi:hypothetical protein
MRLIIAGLLGLVIHITTPAIALTVNAVNVPVLNHQVHPVQLRTVSQVGAANNSLPNKRQGEPIGRVDNVDGVAFIIRLTGTKTPAAAEMEIFLGDTIKTTVNTIINLTFVDNTRFALGEEGEMVIDELIFSPTDSTGRSLFTITQGIFSFLSGKIAKTAPDSMWVKLPVATVGVRGTKVVGRAAKESRENSITLLPDEDGSVGEISVQNSAGTQILSQPFQTTKIKSVSQIPSLPTIISEGAIKRLYGTVSQTISYSHTSGGKAQRGNIRRADSKKVKTQSGKQVIKPDQNKEKKDDAPGQEDGAQVYREGSEPTNGGEISPQGETQDAQNSESDAEQGQGPEISAGQKDASTNELVEAICIYEALCDGEKLNWKGWTALAGIIILFCGLIVILVVLLP